MIIERLEKPDWWDSQILKSDNSTFFQTTFWADYCQENAEEHPIYLAVKEGNEIEGMILAFIDSSKRLRKRLYWHYGPIIFNQVKEEEVLNIILKELDTIAKDNGIFSIEASSPVHGRANAEKIKQIFEENQYESKKWGTFLVRLNNTEEGLRNNLKKAARKKIKYCEENKIEVYLDNSNDGLQNYLELLKETRKRMGMALPPSYPNDVMKKYLEKNMAVFLSKKDGKILAGLGLVFFNGIAIEMGVAQSDFDLNERIYSGDLIKWEVIKWANAQGFSVFDLAGVSVQNRSQKEEGIFQFKEKWGGELVEYYNYEKIMQKSKASIINILKKIRR